MMDLHIHTEFSSDSQAVMEEYCIKAIHDGLTGVCFTDHLDLHPADQGYGYYKADQYFACLNKLRDRYGDDLKILAGVEFAQPHLYPDRFAEVSAYPYDFIIGSIHWVANSLPGKEALEKYTLQEFYSLYWEEILEAVTFGGFDTLGHIDFPKRYFGELVYDNKMIKRIFKKMIESGIALEINTSSLRKGLTESMPDASLLTLYKECGGRKITIGSDAHFVKDLAADFGYANYLADTYGFQRVFYEKRTEYPLIG